MNKPNPLEGKKPMAKVESLDTILETQKELEQALSKEVLATEKQEYVEKGEEKVITAEEKAKKLQEEKDKEIEDMFKNIKTTEKPHLDKNVLLAKYLAIEEIKKLEQLQPIIFDKILTLGEKIDTSKMVQLDKKKYWEELAKSTTLEEIAKQEKEIKEKIDRTNLVDYAGKIVEKIDASSLEATEKDNLSTEVINTMDINSLKTLEKTIDDKLFVINKDSTVTFTNPNLTLGDIIKNEKVILVDKKPAFLNNEVLINGVPQYCYATVDGEFDGRAKVYSDKTKVQVLSTDEAKNYFDETGKPKAVVLGEMNKFKTLENTAKIKTLPIDTTIAEKEEKDVESVAKDPNSIASKK
jgi:hypothetical protein